MGVLGVAATVALALVLAVSAVAKLLDPPGTREAVTGFGVPSRLAGPASVLLAPAELFAALLLLPPSTRFGGLVLAGLLLVVFTGAVLLALRAGRQPACHCFGRLGGADISGRTVIRNALLLALVTAGAAGQAEGRPDGPQLAGALLMGTLTAAAVLAAEYLVGRAARRRREAEDEAAFATDFDPRAAPPFTAETVGGDLVGLEQLLARGLPVLLTTLSPGCGPCTKLRPDIVAWSTAFRDIVTMAVLAVGDRARNAAAYPDVPDLPVLLDLADVREELGIAATPSAVLLDRHGRVASGVANGEPLIRRLIMSTVTGRDEVDTSMADSPDNDRSAEEIDLTFVPTRRASVHALSLGGSTVLLDPTSGATVSLDPIGALVWEVIDGSARLDEIVADLADVYQTDAEVIGPDVLELTRSLGRAGLLVGVAPVTAPEGHLAAQSIHNDHDHEGHDHSGHDHGGHDRGGHEHGGHDHAGHDHGGHDRSEPEAGRPGQNETTSDRDSIGHHP